MITKSKNGFHVKSESGDKNLGGPYKTREEAEHRLKQIEWFKRKDEIAERKKR